MPRAPDLFAFVLALPACGPSADDNPDPEPVAETTGQGESSSEETFDPSGSETTGATPLTPTGGRFRIVEDSAAVDPVGCANEPEDGTPAWFVTFELPQDGTTFRLTEEFAAFVNNYDCEMGDDAFDCKEQVAHDYSTQAVDASVQLDLAYEARWTESTSLEGDYTADFTCEGSGCDLVADQWNILRFPCAVEIQFTGELDQ